MLASASDVKKEAKALPNVKLEYTLPVHEFGTCDTDTQYRETGEQIKRFYFGYSKLNVGTILIYLMVIHCKCFHFVLTLRNKYSPNDLQLISDIVFTHPTHRMVLSRLKNECAPTYLLRFNFDSKRNMVKKTIVGRNVPGIHSWKNSAISIDLLL